MIELHAQLCYWCNKFNIQFRRNNRGWEFLVVFVSLIKPTLGVDCPVLFLFQQFERSASQRSSSKLLQETHVYKKEFQTVQVRAQQMDAEQPFNCKIFQQIMVIIYIFDYNYVNSRTN
eukprot:TRINITY_DN4227_c1_g2_i2.p6 TRINITY_DN4227_c1_g2~~TRINITY_DN4227_c1_g2_i2.p6  ORF type:complete len:118 (+),score=5.23 TRINITY_DN4227_c1_g2_i2:718-1071(+)